jgi:hypothetical protein
MTEEATKVEMHSWKNVSQTLRKMVAIIAFKA